MEIKTEEFPEAAKRELGNARSRAFLKLIPPILVAKREMGLASLPDAPKAMALGAAIRAGAVARLPELLEEFERRAQANGARVIWARNATEANEAILQIARERGVSYVTKGKSMVTEETGLNEVLSRNGVRPWETDLGEFITQLLNRPPFHIVGPAINVPVEEVRDLFLKNIDLKEPTLDPVQLGYAARLYLRDKFHHVQMGITGVNMAVAETGTLLNVENEGNIRFTKASPRTQVSVMSLEKVVPTMADAMHILRLLCRDCTGQRITSYVTLDSGPKKADEIDGPEELFIVLVDNGRSRIYQDRKARQALRCIRCAACLNICPIYRQIGGYAYGWAYSGPMGQVLNPLLLGRGSTRHLYHASTLCGACKSFCPVGIDHPSMFLYYRAKDILGEPSQSRRRRSWSEERFFKNWAHAVKRPWMWSMGIRFLRRFINRHVQGGKVRWIGGRFEGWFKSRDLPALAEKTFHERWEKIKRG